MKIFISSNNNLKQKKILKMKNSAKTITGCFNELTVVYTSSNFKSGLILAAFGKIYWNGKYTKHQVSINIQDVKDNQVAKPTNEDIEAALYQRAIDKLYDVRDAFNNPIYKMN